MNTPFKMIAIAATLTASTALSQSDRVLVDFDDPGLWRTVNDNVMGGRSEGAPRFTEGQMSFQGRTRLENNGGFSSVRSVRRDWKLDGFEGLILRARGDERAYKVTLETDARRRGWRISYWADFKVPGEGWQEIRIPFSAFSPTSFGFKLNGPALDVPKIASIGFIIYDKKAGPFQLDLDWIKAYRATSGLRPMPAVSRLQPVASPASVSQSEDGVLDLARRAGSFGTLLAAIDAAGLREALLGEGPFTVFAPTDAAFAALPDGTVETLLEPGNRAILKSILLYHVVPGSLAATDLLSVQSGASLEGRPLSYRLEGGQLRVNEARVRGNDLRAKNGVVHVIDSVLIPPKESKEGPLAALIERALAEGARFSEAGSDDASSAIYELAITALVTFEDANLAEGSRADLTAALASAENRDRAEACSIMRRALEEAWDTLPSR